MMNKLHLNMTARYGSFDLKKIDINGSSDHNDITQLGDTERKITDMEKRLSNVEKNDEISPSSPSSNTSAITQAVQTYQVQVLTKLKIIRDTLIAEVDDISKIKEEKDLAVTENTKLKKDVEKLNYRISILIKSLNSENAKKCRPEYG